MIRIQNDGTIKIDEIKFLVWNAENEESQFFEELKDAVNMFNDIEHGLFYIYLFKNKGDDLPSKDIEIIRK